MLSSFSSYTNLFRAKKIDQKDILDIAKLVKKYIQYLLE